MLERPRWVSLADSMLESLQVCGFQSVFPDIRREDEVEEKRKGGGREEERGGEKPAQKYPKCYEVKL